MIRNLILCLILIYTISEINCQDQDNNTHITTPEPEIEDEDDQPEEDFEGFDSSQSYCFRFTWLGPAYDNITVPRNGTCKGLAEAEHFNLKDTPCRQPLVATSDRSPPDMDHLWINYREKVLCRNTPGQSCVRYSYSFNDQLQNITYMCAKAWAKDEGAVTKGCYSQTINGYEVKACVCQPVPGIYKPCNSASYQQMSLLVLISAGVVLFQQELLSM